LLSANFQEIQSFQKWRKYQNCKRATTKATVFTWLRFPAIFNMQRETISLIIDDAIFLPLQWATISLILVFTFPCHFQHSTCAYLFNYCSSILKMLSVTISLAIAVAFSACNVWLSP
jgi:hypothetical protein